MCAALYWIIDHLDRILALIAIGIAAYAIWDVRKLFKELERRDRTTEERVRLAVLRELMNHAFSFAAFFRAAQYIDFNPLDFDRDAAVTMFMGFHLQKLLAPNADVKELAALQKKTRDDTEEAAKGYAEMIIASKLGTLKEGFEFKKP